MTITLNGTTGITTTGLTSNDIYLSGGVYLGGTGAANKLTDYESGNWTPVLGSTGTNPTITYSSVRNGFYTKVGRLVTLTGNIEMSAYSGNGGNLRIEALPFSVSTATNYRACGSIVIVNTVNDLTGSYTSIQLAFNSGGSCQMFYRLGSTGGMLELPSTLVDAGTGFRFQITYMTA